MKRASFAFTGVVLAATATFGLQGRGAPAQMPAPAPSAAPAVLLPPIVVREPRAWERPAGPLRVALQAGHWKAAEAPDEQRGLRDNGTRGGGKAEWEVNLEIARRTAAMLEGAGYQVDVLPTTIPPGYWADLFVSIHADGSPSASMRGYRVASPRRDQTGKAEEFASLLRRVYGDATGLRHIPEVTRRMRGYYAFNSRRYQHALHPMTVGVIIETGFLTSPLDRRIIVDDQERPARGIADAILLYLETLSVEPEAVPSSPPLSPPPIAR